jgi:peptide/nickel transport system permease protein
MMDRLKAFAHHPSGVLGAVILAGVLLSAVLASWLFPGDPWDMAGPPFAPPMSDAFALGTDMLGRDVASCIFHGARISLLIGVTSTAAAVVVGVLIGATAGYLGGWIDDALMRLTELFQVIPGLVLAILLVATLGPSFGNLILAIAGISWPPLARLTRAEFLRLRGREFVQAAVCQGERPISVIVRHILPNAISPIIVTGSLTVATAILIESALSFMGLGDPNSMSWGFMIGAARSVLRQAWWMSVFPGAAILLTVLAINLVGEALNDALNPRRSRAVRQS